MPKQISRKILWVNIKCLDLYQDIFFKFVAILKRILHNTCIFRVLVICFLSVSTRHHYITSVTYIYCLELLLRLVSCPDKLHCSILVWDRRCFCPAFIKNSHCESACDAFLYGGQIIGYSCPTRGVIWLAFCSTTVPLNRLALFSCVQLYHCMNMLSRLGPLQMWLPNGKARRH
jgi:hypothetical protein